MHDGLAAFVADVAKVDNLLRDMGLPVPVLVDHMLRDKLGLKAAASGGSTGETSGGVVPVSLVSKVHGDISK